MRTVTAALLILSASASLADDWRQFRGNATNGVADARLPTELSGESIRWKISLPGRGLSGPIVVGRRVFVTSSSGHLDNMLHTLCYDAETGKQLWERTSLATGRTVCHSTMNVATPTPASDGQRVFSFYSSNDLVCHDLDGNLQWYRGLGREHPNASNSLGMSSSPVVIGTTVIVQVESDAESFACGIDTRTGKTKWKKNRPKRANWTSPSVAADRIVLLQSSKGLSAVEPDTGNELWTYSDGASTIPSASVVGDLIFLQSNGTTVLKMSADQKSYKVVWTKSNIRAGTSSQLILGGRVYSVGRGTVLTCADGGTGERLWQKRLGQKDAFSSTPVASNGLIYLFSESGKALVIKADGDGAEVISQLDLTERVMCTPAIAHDALYVRSDKSMWKFAKED